MYINEKMPIIEDVYSNNLMHAFLNVFLNKLIDPNK